MTQQETENTANDGSWLSIVADLIDDISEQQVSGSVLLIVILALTFAWASREVFGLVGRRRNKGR